MNNSDIKEPLFREAVEAIDGGDTRLLRHLLNKNPMLVSRRLDFPTEGYFKQPYLLWFIADNPIRNEKLAPNISELTELIIQFVRRHSPDSFQEQINYTLGLVVTGRVPREAGVQIQLIDLLIEAGAIPGSTHGALAHSNLEAAERLIEKGSRLTLTAAICLNRTNDIIEISKLASDSDLQIALVAAAFYGKTDMIKFLIERGVNVNAYLDNSSGFHYHATALHQAVYSGSLDSVKLLVEAGARPDAKDRIYEGTALEWSQHMQTNVQDVGLKKKYAEIETYLVTINK